MLTAKTVTGTAVPSVFRAWTVVPATAFAPRRHRRPGVTLIEMLIVVALVGLMVSITFPSVASGVDTLRLNGAADAVVAFFNEALNRAERRQQAVEITIEPRQRALVMRSTEPGFERRVELAQSVRIASVAPPAPEAEPDAARVFMLYPSGAVPRIAVELVNARGARRLVSVDPITGVPEIRRLP